MQKNMAKIPHFCLCLLILTSFSSFSSGQFLFPDDQRLSTTQRSTNSPQIANHAAIDTSVLSTAQNHITFVNTPSQQTR